MRSWQRGTGGSHRTSVRTAPHHSGSSALTPHGLKHPWHDHRNSERPLLPPASVYNPPPSSKNGLGVHDSDGVAPVGTLSLYGTTHSLAVRARRVRPALAPSPGATLSRAWQGAEQSDSASCDLLHGPMPAMPRRSVRRTSYVLLEPPQSTASSPEDRLGPFNNHAASTGHGRPGFVAASQTVPRFRCRRPQVIAGSPDARQHLLGRVSHRPVSGGYATPPQEAAVLDAVFRRFRRPGLLLA